MDHRNRRRPRSAYDPEEQETVPPWARRAATNGRIEYEREVGGDDRRSVLRLLATRSARDVPPGGLGPQWQVAVGRRTGELETNRTVGWVGTRSDAVATLVEAMRVVNHAIRAHAGSDPTSSTLADALREVTRPDPDDTRGAD